MTTTPTVWKPSFTANEGFTGGLQTVPQTIGLANGNILVVWEDDTQGPSPYTDIMGRIFDPEGVAIGLPFQINSAVVGSDETGPKIVALPDGGYVVAYGGYFEAIGGFIEVQRFDSNGNSVFANSNPASIGGQKRLKPGKLRIAQPEDIIHHQTPAVSEFESGLN